MAVGEGLVRVVCCFAEPLSYMSMLYCFFYALEKKKKKKRSIYITLCLALRQEARENCSGNLCAKGRQFVCVCVCKGNVCVCVLKESIKNGDEMHRVFFYYALKSEGNLMHFSLQFCSLAKHKYTHTQ